MPTPYFSVIIPVYNAHMHLKETVASILSQSETDFEIIMIDDGSSDNSLAIILEMASQDERIKIISQSNQGVSKTRNLGADIASGKYLAFMDADDIWHPEKLAKHRALHDRLDDVDASYAQIAFVDDQQINGNGAKTFSTVSENALTIDEIIAENPVCTTSNLVVSRMLFLSSCGFDQNMTHAEDQEWLARVVSKGYNICGIDEYLVDYRLSPDGLSVDLPAMHEGWKQLANTYVTSDGLKGAEAIFLRYLSRRALRAGAPPRIAYNYAMQGLSSDWQAFFKDKKRGWLTLISAWVGFILPRSARIQIFT